MNKNYLIIGLIIVALLVIGVIAAKTGDNFIFSGNNERNEASKTEEGHNAPTIEVSDQVVKDGQIIVELVRASVDGWLVIHPAPEGVPELNKVIGYSKVSAGENSAIEVNLDDEDLRGDLLIAMLYEDSGEIDVLEIGDEENIGEDLPAVHNNEVIHRPFYVLSEEDLEEDENEGIADEEAQENSNGESEE